MRDKLKSITERKLSEKIGHNAEEIINEKFKNRKE